MFKGKEEKDSKKGSRFGTGVGAIKTIGGGESRLSTPETKHRI